MLISKVSLRALVARLATLAIATTPVGAAAATVDCLDKDAELEIDRGAATPREAGDTLGRSLAEALSELRPLHATQLVASWALSPDPVRRLAVANSLEWTFPLVGDALAIDHLSRDDDPTVRAAAARAAWARRDSGGDGGVLARLAADPDPTVRAIAHAGDR